MQSSALKPKQGFTLIEVVVVSILAAVLGVGILTLLVWMFGTSKEDQQRAHLQTGANIVLEEIARRVHVSSTVVTPDSATLLFYASGTQTGSFSFSGDTLRQDNLPFKVAGKPIMLVGDSSFFSADTASGGEYVNTQLVLRHDNARFVLHTGILRCRN